jgi:hypothetical protein
VHEVLGNFPLDSKGRIIDAKKVIWKNQFRDYDSQLVNEKGYLINEKTGAIRSRFTYEDLFMPTMGGSNHDFGELPMPYRIEKWNFNPHKIMGSFDYDRKSKKPIFLKNKYDQFTDKNFRPVNQGGLLINKNEAIIDNEGHVKFNKEMLTAQSILPPLYNYQGRLYKITDIIGQLGKDEVSKEIMIRVDKLTGRGIDDLGRPVNAMGYLIDDIGNIIDVKGDVIFNFWELYHLEPPKIFSFTQFSLNWIRGNLKNGQTKFDPREDQIFDLDGRLVNTAGYLIDKDDNIIDQYNRVTFRKELLTNNQG